MLTVWASAARAETSHPNFELSAGTHFMLSPVESCRNGGEGAVSCGVMRMSLGVEAATQFRLLAWLAPGLFGSWSSRSGGEIPSKLKQSQGMWRVGAQLRFTPGEWPRGMWFLLQGGAALMVETADGLVHDSGPEIHVTTTQVAPLAAAALGWDWIFVRQLLLGAEVRCVLTAFDRHPPELSSGILADELGSILWFSTGMRAGVVF